MVQSVLNYYCLVSRRCCFCISPKVGTIIIACLGQIPSILLVLMYGAEEYIFVKHGVHPVAAEIIVHLYAIVGILMCGVHIILLVAAVAYNEKLILMYLWFAVAYFAVDVLIVLCVSVSSILNGFVLFGTGVLLFECFYWLFLYMCILPVVNGFRRNIHTIVIYV